MSICVSTDWMTEWNDGWVEWIGKLTFIFLLFTILVHLESSTKAAILGLAPGDPLFNL